MNLKTVSLLVILGIATFIILVGGYSALQYTPSFSLESRSPNRITVVGSAESKEENEVATFSAGVSSENANKDTAVTENNTKMNVISEALKKFGLPDADIKTQNVSLYEGEDWKAPVDDKGKHPMVWYASNKISITLKEVERAQELLTVLQSTQATNINGPYFSIEDVKEQETALLKEALKNARDKADAIAEENRLIVGDVLSVVEGNSSSSNYDYYRYSDMAVMAPIVTGGGGGSPVYSGTSKLQKTVTATFELVN